MCVWSVFLYVGMGGVACISPTIYGSFELCSVSISFRLLTTLELSGIL